MKRSQSYWDSDDEDDGPRTYRNVRPASVMHQDYVKSRQTMTMLDDEIYRQLLMIQKYEDDIKSKHWLLRAEAGLNLQEAERQLKRLRRRWSFEANNYHRYDDVGATTHNAYHAYMSHASNQ